MKRKFTKLLAALGLLALFILPTTGWGQSRSTVTDVMNQTWTGVTGTAYSQKTELSGSASDAVYTVQCAGGNSSIQLRSSNNNSGIVSTTSGGTVTKVTVTWNSNTTNGRTLNVYGKNSAYSAPTDLYGSNSGTLIGTIVCGTSTELTITDSYEYIGMRSNSGAMYLDEIDVVWETGGGNTPSISASNVNILYSSTSGSLAYEIQNGVDGGAITSAVVTTSNPSGWLTVNGSNPYTSPISLSCEANTSTTTEKTATVQLTYTYNTNQTVTKDVTVTQGKAPITIAEVREQGTGSVVTKGIVTSCAGTTGYIQDATAAVCVYGISLTVGDEVVVSGSLTTFNGLLEISNPTVVAVLSNNNTVTPIVKTIAEINSDYEDTNSLQGMLVKIENATVTAISESNTTISQTNSNTTSTIVVRGISGVEYAVNDVFSELTGNIGAYNVAQIVNPTNVTLQQNTDPVINASNPAKLSYDATSGEIPYTIDNPVTGVTLSAVLTTGDWITTESITVASDKVTFSCSANEGNADRTATITLSYTGADNKVITVTQGHYQVDYATLPFDYAGGVLADFSALTGTSYNLNDNGSYAESNAPYRIKFTKTGDYLQVKTNERPGIVTIGVKVFNTGTDSKITVQGSTDGSSFTDIQELTISASTTGTSTITTTNSFNENFRYVRLYFTKGVNVGVGPISIAKYVDPSTVPSIDADAGNALAYNATNGSIAYEIENYVDGEMSAATTASWISNVTVVPDATVDELGDVTFSVTENTSTNSRSATVTLTYTYNTNQTVTKDVTVTQAGKPAVIIASPVQLTAAANDNGTIDVTYANFTPADKDINLYDNQECTTAFSDDWFEASFATISSVTDFNHIDYVVEANAGAARTVYMKVEVMDGDLNIVSTVVTITQAAYSVPGTWELTTLADLTPADVFVIVGSITNGTDEETYALPNNDSDAPDVVSVTIDNSGSTPVLSSAPDANLQWNVIGNATDGYTFYPAGSATTWLNCNTTADSKSNDNIRIGSSSSSVTRKIFELDENDYLITKDDYVTRYLSIYVNNSGDAQDWRGYTNTSNHPAVISFFKKVTDPVTKTKTIAGYGTSTGGYQLIASPVASVTPSTSNGFVASTAANYDLYYFDQNPSDEKQWQNFKVGSGFNIVSGKGYLYASKEGTELTFNGQPYNGNGVVVLDYTSGKDFAGWNLIGNPYATGATIDKAYYRLNSKGTALNASTESTTIATMEGVFVQATAANETATFTAQSRGGEKNVIAKANINVIGANGSVIDNAIVRFDEGQTLEKFMFNENGTKVYFTEDHKDYAIVRSEARGEMPVNFKAAENGTYTINVSTENLDVDYLHLIDNLTGTDVDLLATPTYTFESRKNDYASRFRLRFSANNNNNNNNNNSVSDEFAFVSNGEIVIMNEGEATLQVIDMLGRTVSTQTVDGNARIDKMNANGVYVLRLIDGNEVKTQKIVIR